MSINESDFVRLKRNLHAIYNIQRGIDIRPDLPFSANRNSSALHPQFEKDMIDCSNQHEIMTI